VLAARIGLPLAMRMRVERIQSSTSLTGMIDHPGSKATFRMASDRSTHFVLAREVLHHAAWLEASNSATRSQFLREGSLRLLADREEISRRGDTISTLCLVIDGSLEVSITSIDGHRHIMSYLEAGQIMNLIPLLDDQLAIHDARAHNACAVLLVPKASFTAAVERDPGLSRALLRLLCLRSRVSYDRLADAALLSLRARCARALLSMVPPFGERRAGGIAITLKLSQNEFADMVGASRQSVNRELKLFVKEGIIRTTYSRFVVLDHQALQAVATEHY